MFDLVHACRMAFVVMAVVGLVVGLIGLLTEDDSAEPFPSCPHA